MSRDLASAYVLCLHTFVVPNLRRDKGKGLGKKEQIGRLKKLMRMNEVDFKTGENYIITGKNYIYDLG